jgi:hypothetical protein
MAASAVADIVVTVILAIVTAGVGAAASVISKSGRLVKVTELLEKITAVLRRIGPRTGLLEKGEEAAAKMGRAEKRIAKAVKEVREAEADVKKTERAAKLEKEAREGYDAAKATDGPKTTPKITGDKGTTVNVDGHKIYDPSHPPLSSNPKAQYRFSDPSYRSTGGDVYFGENVGTAFHEVRKNVHGKSLYVGEARVDNILDLSDPDVVKQMNIDPAKLTARVDDVVAQKKVYGYTNQIANQAYDAGYSGIVYPSSRKAGSNAVVLFEGRYDSKAIKPILDMSIP